ncbi:SRPBCC domain-containing protein [Salinibacterium sp. ZJ77]|uniref:SRPBCC family protein n=1 Tax=Salinibacterium sp. ZJ77 TaxID=2708337 RepID=UPI00141E74E5|nr:SRPBCC domain-containing protein [Salinibacterium sp. ZJ77]
MNESTISEAGFTVSRTFDAPRELVWRLWTEPEHFSVWFGTAVVDVPLETLSLDVRVGGQLRAVMQLPSGDLIHWEGEYREVDPPSRLVFTLTDVPGTDPGDPIVAEFAEVEGGTRVTLFQPRHGFTDEQIQATILGYGSFFDAMETILTDLH